MTAIFDRVAILGLGLMGGSLGLALRRGVAREVVGWARRPATAAAALNVGALDRAAVSPAEAVREAELVVLCTPVSTIPALATACAPHVARGAVVTDVGSTKVEIERAIVGLWPDGRAHYVGSHPMAGSEQTGLSAARADLYDGAVVAVTSPAAVPAAAVERVCRFWGSVGASVRRLDAATHDRLVARTSHLPHLMAAALVESVLGTTPDPESVAFCGPGFRDTTRVAAGSAALWIDIVSSNREAVLSALDALTATLEGVRGRIAAGDDGAVEAFLARAARARRDLG